MSKLKFTHEFWTLLFSFICNKIAEVFQLQIIFVARKIRATIFLADASYNVRKFSTVLDATWWLVNLLFPTDHFNHTWTSFFPIPLTNLH